MMNGIFTATVFSALAAAAVWWAGRKDAGRDPDLTTLALALAAVAPAFSVMPKLAVLPWEPAAQTAHGPGFGPWLAGLWLAGSAVALFRLAAGLFQLARWWRRSEWIGRVRISDRRRAELRILPGLRSPVAAGIFRPVVYLPAGWDRWPEPMRATVLAHELAHLRHHDPLLRLVASLACAVHWFNPLVHWMARRLEAQCEFRSDARVLAAGFRPADYARLLCSLADSAERSPFGASSSSPVAAVAMARRSGLRHRVERLLSNRPPSTPRWVPGLLVGLLLAVALACSILGPAAPKSTPATVSPTEIRLRLTADPFPANP